MEDQGLCIVDATKMEDRRVADYFVVAGLDPAEQLPLEEFSNEAVTKPFLDPITDITVINRSLGEKVPKGFDCLECTPSGLPANLNHGAFRCSEMYICYRRGQDKPPLKDLGVLYEGKERLMEGCEVVHTTMQGNPANVNNSTSSRTYLTYRRADKASASDTLVVVDICIILGNRGEEPPLTFLKIYKNLNKGMIGSDVFLCYKKAMVKKNVLAYKAAILDRYPVEDHEDFPLPPPVAMFCLPMGATIECWSAEAQHPVPNFSTFVLTGAGGDKVYGAAVGFYEEYKEDDLTDNQMRSLGLKNKQIREQYHISKTVHVRKSISLLSHWPFFDAFKKFLSQLYKVSITGPHTVPLERHISHFMYDVPYPSPERPRILVQLTHDSLSLCMPEDSPLPQSGASFITMLRNLGPEHTMTLLLFVLLETKILLHSLRPTVLTEVAEAVSTMIFPFHWQCPFIPLCPLGLSDVLNAPCPFIVGVDSRYFDLYDPPVDVICVDLDTNRIVLPENKKNMTYKLLPKRPTRVMHEALMRLYERASQHAMPNHTSDEVSLEMTHFDLEFKKKKADMQLELAIQEIFLRFTASVLKDYRNYLKPIMKHLQTTDASSLFDMQGFAKSMEKGNIKFLTQMMHTQMFFRFIEERSFVSDKDASLAFFDECTEKVEDLDETKLIETDNTQTSERTVFIMPPEPVGLPEGVKYSYNGFPTLKPELFVEEKKKSLLSVSTKQTGCPNSPLARRTKQEVKSAQKTAIQQVKEPKAWAKCLVSYCYSLWFVAFPAYVQSHPSKLEALKTGLAVLMKMQKENLKTVDEVCYRVLMQLAGQYNKPGLAVHVFYQMKKHKVAPNAITYGYYNKVMLEAVWPSPQSKAKLRWMKIRNVIIGVAQFGRALRRRSQSIYSTNSGSDMDQISHTSADSFDGQAGQAKQSIQILPLVEERNQNAREGSGKEKNSGSIEESLSTGNVSDRGYNSMTQEDAKNLSSQLGGCVEEGVEENASSDRDHHLQPHPLHSCDESNNTTTTTTTNGTTRSSGNTTTNESGNGKTSSSCSSSSSKYEGWAPMALSFITGYSKPRQNSLKAKKEVHIVDEESEEHAEFVRPRQGSIVRKTSVHSNHITEYDSLKGSLFCNSSGLVIMSQASLDKGNILPACTSLQSEAAAAKRKRHKSACDRTTSAIKASRSMSIFAGWTFGRSVEEDNKAVKISEGKSDLEEGSGVLTTTIEDRTLLEGVHVKHSVVSEEECSIVGANLDDTQSGAGVCGESEEEKNNILHNNSESNVVVLESNSSLLGESNTDGLCESPSDAHVHSCPASSSSQSNDLSPCGVDPPANPELGVLSSSDNSNRSDDNTKCETVTCDDEVDALSISVASNILPHTTVKDNSNDSSQNVDNVTNCDNDTSSKVKSSVYSSQEEKERAALAKKREMRRSVSISEDRFSGQYSDGSSSAMKTSMSESGCREEDLLPEMKTPVRQISEDSQSVTSLTDKRDLTSEFVLRRSQSLKKTNEVIGSFLKYASKAAYSKFNELKQTISIRNGSFGSLGSPSQSVEELDANDGNSSATGTIRERLRYGGSQDLMSHSEESEADQSDRSDNNLSRVSTGSVPSPSYLDGFKDVSLAQTGIPASAMQKMVKVAMEVEMSSCSRCTNPRCSRLLYDEEVMAGWLAEDSNLNTMCPYCKTKFVPHLQVYIKDWRGDSKSLVLDGDDASDKNKFHFQEDQTSTPNSKNSTTASSASASTSATATTPNRKQSMLDKGDVPLTTQEAAKGLRRRCTSECLSSFAEDTYGSQAYISNMNKSPLSLSIDENCEENFTSVNKSNILNKDFMTRSASSSEPQVVPYLSPLVLRKELEYILDHEGDACLASDSFVEDHSIIFWNLIWFFRRIEVTSHLTSFLLTSNAFSFNKNKEKSTKSKEVYNSHNILIRPQWDNVRIHDEIGLPMYIAWQEGHKSTVLDALVTESASFSRRLMFEIVSSIKRNNVMEAVKVVANGRRRVKHGKCRFRSMYREILFLSFVECGRENIDHDAFDLEYATAFEEKLSPIDKRRLQIDDFPKSKFVQHCRRAFSALEI